MNKQDLMVTIRCTVYNHEPYLRQCLDGFVMQKTNFKFEAIVHDDASTDGSATIIREYAEKYPEIIKPILQTENQYSKRDGSLTRIMNEHTRGKYIAICEGDDYWIDPLKLQKQVDFMENHLDYGLVCSDINEFNQLTKEIKYNFFKNKRWNIKYSFEDFLINAWFLAPCTWLYRKEYLENDFIKNKFIVGDLPLLLEISSNSKIKKLKESTAVYRVLPKSASHGFNFNQQIEFQKKILEIQLYYMKKHNKIKLLKRIITRWLLVAAKISYNYREYKYMTMCLCNFIKIHLCKNSYIEIMTNFNI